MSEQRSPDKVAGRIYSNRNASATQGGAGLRNNASGAMMEDEEDYE